MNIDEIKKALGLPPEATDEDVLTAIKAGAQAIDELAEARAREEAGEARHDLEEERRHTEEAEQEAEEAKRDLENEKKAHEATKAALANEQEAHAKMALDAAVREKRIGESARETWKTRLVNEGAPAYAALANEKPLPTRDASKGLANECGEQTDSEKRKAMVNEIMTSEKVDYDTAWQRAARRSPELFK